MSVESYNPETHYLKSNVYTTRNGDIKTTYYIAPRNVKYNQRGRPAGEIDMSGVNIDKLKELRKDGLSWGKLGKKFDITAYQARKIYETNES